MNRTAPSISGMLLILGSCVARAAGLPIIQDHLDAARSHLRQGQVREALQRAAAAYDLSPRLAETQTVLGDIAYRQADFEKALSFYRSALDLDPACARAYFGIGQVEQLHFRRKSAGHYLSKAYNLNPRDPEIIRVLALSAPDRKTKLALLNEYVALGIEEGQQQFDFVTGQLRIERQLGDRQMDQRATPYRQYNLHLTAFCPGVGGAAGLLLKASLNGGKPVRLVLDTGAHGIVIGKRQAQRLGLETMAASYIRGLGNGTGIAAMVALARTVQIDDLLILNTLVEVTDRSLVQDADGVIGANLFQEFLLKLNFSEKLLELVPFPEGSPTMAAGDKPWHDWDRQVPVPGDGFVPLRKIGDLLLIKAKVNRKCGGYFLLDTGAAVTTVARQTVMEARPQYPGRFQGVSGPIPNCIHISPVELEFSGKAFTEPNVVAFDHEPMSNQIGIEVSGLIGYSSLNRSAVTTINYKDGLIQFSARH